MRNKIIAFLLLSFCCVFWGKLSPVHACSPAPWSFEDAYKSKAMVYGKVIETTNGGRKATVDVISYMGPGKAPRTVHMPVTVDDRDQYEAGYSCPDFSMKFEAGEEYVFFLADIPPNLQYLKPSWITAAHVEDRQAAVTIGYPDDSKDDLMSRLKQYGDQKGYMLQLPDSDSPVWGSESGGGWLMYGIILAALSIIAVIFHLYRRRIVGS